MAIRSPSNGKRNSLVDVAGSLPLKTVVLRGSAWTLAGYAASQLLRLGGNLVLTRLLFPEAFGIMALVYTVMQAVQMFSDMGIETGAVRSARDDLRFLNTAWTLQVLRGCLLWLIACLAAYPVSVLYEEPLLVYLVPVAGFTAMVNGFRSTSVLTLRRNVRLRPLVIWETGTQAFGIACMLVLAWYTQSIWALVIGGLIQMLAATITSHFLVPGRKVAFAWDSTSVHELVHFGKWILLGTAITFLIQRGDIALLGVMLSKEMLGFYAIATIWSRAGIQALLRLNAWVLFPIYSALYNQFDRELRRKVFLARLGLLGIFLPLMWLLAIMGQVLVDFLYDPRYRDVGWMLQVLSVGAIGAIISATAGNFLLAAGDSRRHMLLQTGRGLLLLTGIVVGGTLGGERGVVLGVAASKIFDYPILVWAVKPYNVWMPSLDLSAFALSAAVLFMGFAAVGVGPL